MTGIISERNARITDERGRPFLRLTEELMDMKLKDGDVVRVILSENEDKEKRIIILGL